MRTLRRFLARWQNWLGLLLIAPFVFIAIAAPLLSPEDPTNPGPIKVVGRQIDHQPHPPSQIAPLGTLPGQVSVFHTLVWGTRSAITFGLSVAIFTAVLGVLIGTTSAYFGGFFNNLLMRITDAFLSFPVIAGVVFISQLISITLYNSGVSYYPIGGLGVITTVIKGYYVYPPDMPLAIVILQMINPVMLALILFSWMPYARMMNSIVLRIKQIEYVQSAHALGASHVRIIFRHLIPNAIAPIIVLASRDVGGMVLLQATFTFVGLGGDSLWGMLLVLGRDWIISPGGNIFTYWWIFLPTTLALVVFGIAWSLIGDSLNDVLNPRG